MKKLLLASSLLLAICAHAAPASTASIEELLVLTRAESMMDAMYGNVEQAMQQGMRQALGDKPLTADQQKSLEALPREFARVFREEMGWNKLKTDIVQIYAETFQQEEIDGLLVFYKSPAGKAFIEKTPVVMQKSMTLTQGRMQSVFPKMRAVMEKAIADIKAMN